MPVTKTLTTKKAFGYSAKSAGSASLEENVYAGVSSDTQREYRARILFNAEEVDALEAGGAVSTFQKLTIRLNNNAATGDWSGNKTIKIRSYAELPDKGQEGDVFYGSSWEAMDNYYAEHSVTFGKYNTFSVVVTDPTEVRYILQNGIGIIDTSTGIAKYDSEISPSSVTFSSKAASPIISADTTEMTGGYISGEAYIHEPDKTFSVAYTYTQEEGGAMDYATVKVTRGTTVLYSEKQTSPKTVVIPKAAWGDLPAEGNIQITAYTKAVAGLQGKTTKTIPYRVALREVTVETHEQDDVIDSDKDVSLAWNSNVIAHGDASCPAPVYWKVWLQTGDAAKGTKTTTPEVTWNHMDLWGASEVTVRIETFYTEDGVVGTYGDNGYFLRLKVRQVAEAGSITIETDDYGTVPPLPVVSWDAVGQTAFRVRFGTFESGAVFGGETEYAVPRIYEDGVYPVQVSVQDKNGRWTEWTPTEYATVRNRATAVSCTADIRIQEGRVLLDLTGEGAAVWYAIYRNGELIGQIPYSDMAQYTDPWVNGEAIYEVRAVTADRYYATTGEIPMTLVLSDDVLTDGNGNDIVLRYTAEHPRKYVYKTSEKVHMVHFSGKKFPVAFRSGNYTRSITLAYTDPDKTLADLVEACDGSEVFFRDVEGGSIYGVMGRLQTSKSILGCAVSFEITETDRTKTVDFIREGV